MKFTYNQQQSSLRLVIQDPSGLIIKMIIMLVVFSLIAKIDTASPQSCFYSQRVTFFKGNSVASPSRPQGYMFNVIWDSPQASIVNSSLLFTVVENQRHVFLKYEANILYTTFTLGSVNIRPLNGSEILSITMNIVLLKSCKGTARLILHQLNNYQLTPIRQSINIDTGVTFKGSISNYRYEAFIRDFDGYPTNGAINFGFYLDINPIILNSNIHTLYLGASTGNITITTDYVYLNSFRFTYVLVDIYSFQVTPIVHNHANLWLSTQMYVQVKNELSPFADKKCMLGIKHYVLTRNIIQRYSLTLTSSKNYTLVYNYGRNPGANFLPSLFCFGYCQEGTGRSISNTCSPCPKLSITCSNSSYSLTCISGYYPQPKTIGIQKCFFCLPACSICSNYSSCMVCQATNLMTQQGNCRKCPSNSWLAGGICSSVHGCSLAESISGQSVCRFCNPQQLFEIYPVQGKCICIKGYQLKNGKCIDYCGDGLIYDQQCDDGNRNSKDGCSLLCKQEKGYNCSRRDVNSPSVCVFVDKIRIQFVSIKRVNLENRLILVFQILPSHFNGLLANQIKGYLKANISIKIDSIAYQIIIRNLILTLNHQYYLQLDCMVLSNDSTTIDRNLIIVETTFDEDIKNQQARFILYINDPLVDQQYVSVIIRLNANEQFVKLQKIILAKTIKYIFSSFTLIVLLIFLVSLRFHKMIGLQTIIPFQIIYLSYILNRNQTQLFSLFSYFAASAIDFTYYINGSTALYSSQSILSFSSQNQNVCLIIAFCISFPTFFISAFGISIHSLKEKSLFKQKLYALLVNLHNRVCLPLNCWLLAPLLIIKSTIFKTNKIMAQNAYLLSIDCIFVILIIFYQWRAVFFIKSTFLQSNKIRSLYIPLFSTFLFLVSLLLSASYLRTITFYEPWIIGLYMLGLLVCLCFRPYRSHLHNAGLLVGILQVVFFLAWSTIRNMNDSLRSEENQLFGLFICLSLAATSIILAVVRLIFEAIGQNQQIKKDNSPSSSIQNTMKANISLKDTINLETRYQTNAIIPQYLKSKNLACQQPIYQQYFKPSQNNEKSQLKKYLMEKVQNIMKRRKIINMNL